MSRRFQKLTFALMLLVMSVPWQAWSWGWGPKDPKTCVKDRIQQLTNNKVTISTKAKDELKKLNQGSGETKQIVKKFYKWVGDAEAGKHRPGGGYQDHDVGGGRNGAWLNGKYRVIYKQNGTNIDVVDISDHNKRNHK